LVHLDDKLNISMILNVLATQRRLRHRRESRLSEIEQIGEASADRWRFVLPSRLNATLLDPDRLEGHGKIGQYKIHYFVNSPT
jgi:hypothetical protein